MRRARTPWILLGLVVALGTVTIAAAGSADLSGSARRPADALLDYAISVLLVLMAVGTVTLVVLLVVGRKELADQALRMRSTRRRRIPLFLVLLVLFSIVVAARAVREADTEPVPIRPPGEEAGSADPGPPGERYTPEFTLVPVLLVALLGIGGTVAWYLSYRARSRALAPPAEPLAEALADVLAETLDDLRAERDPRRAVIAAYARLERTLAAYGLPRRPAEAPLEFLGRVLTDLGASALAARRLTLLFERARFSQHAIGGDMKEDAIEALETVQRELLAAEERERVAREAAFRRAAGVA